MFNNIWKSKALHYLPFLIFATINLWAVLKDNVLFTGDMGMTGLMTHDMQNGRFYSWYFYGTNYFGNFQPFVLSFLTRLTGITRESLFFWENIAFIVATLLLLSKLKYKSIILTTLAGITLLIPHKLYDFTYFPMGFAWLTCIVTAFYCLFDWIVKEDRTLTLPVHAFVVGMFPFALWYNSLILMIFPAYLILLYLLRRSVILPRPFKFLLFTILGMIVGGIPLLLGTLQTRGSNLRYFSQNRTENYYVSLKYVVRDFLGYWIKDPILTLTQLRANPIQTLANNPSLFVTLLFALSALMCLVFVLKKFRKEWVLLIFLISSTGIIIAKNYSTSDPIFYYLRYGIVFYTLLTFSILKGFDYLQSTSKGNYTLDRQLVGLFSIVVLAGLSVSTLGNKIKLRYLNPQVNQIVAQDMRRNNIKYLYCENYWAVCSSLAFYFINTDTRIEITDPDGFNVGVPRNPNDHLAVTRAYERGEKVYSLIPSAKVTDQKVIKTYPIQGGFSLTSSQK